MAGLLCGVLSGCGIGGGSMLMVWMTALCDVPQKTAQAINLLYFLPASAAALFFHIRNRMVCWRAVIPAALCGCITAAVAAWMAASMEVHLLKKLFGAFLLLVGICEMKKKPRSG